jgi:glutathione-regulated potassium-efflux system ancillary protein KefG
VPAARDCLVVVAHPNLPKSRINAELLRAAGGQERVTLHVLYACYPDFAVDGDRERRLLDEHRTIVLQFPFRWYSTPPLLKLWLDEVLAHGYAYGTGGTALHGKVLQLAISTGRPAHEYRRDGDAGFTMAELLRPFEVTARLCGLRFAEPFLVHGGRQIPDSILAEHARQYQKLLANMGGSAVDTVDRLSTLRTELDRIDDALLAAIRDRIACCVRIARFKRENDVPMMQPHRIAAVHDHAKQFAAEHGLDAGFLQTLYDLVIAETCRVEDEVMADDAR